MKKLVLLSVFFIFAITAFSEVPNEISYNGVLRSYKNIPKGKAQINFKIYDKPEGGTAVWESGNQNVELLNGIFSSVLKPDKKKVDWRKKDFWLQLVVDGGEFLPRAKLTSQIYSLHSSTAENLSSDGEIKIEVGASAAYIGVNGGKVYYKSSANTEAEYFGVPVGTIIAFAGTICPKGYLPCDGRQLDKTKYLDLFAAIGTIYGGDGSTNFKVPDFRGMFLRGAGSQPVDYPSTSNRTTYASEALGIRQGDAVRDIRGYVWLRGVKYQFDTYSGLSDTKKSSASYTQCSDEQGMQIDFEASKVVPTANENRPVNYAVNYYIKY
jgi:hypothetical protein